ncbi:MAG: cytochrome c biogenesis protein [Bacteroidaceae bacterium]
MNITWNQFGLFALLSILPWTIGSVLALCRSRRCERLSAWFTAAGLLVYIAFIAGLWHTLERPPLRTLGETRLWYSLFMVASGWFVYLRWRYRWIPLFSLITATVFILLNLLHPEIHDRSLMPALQSAWFVPHVTVYIFSYSLFGCTFLLALAGLWQRTASYLAHTSQLVGIGLAFLTFGMLSGCIWAKQAWGTYWSWDPKETWAVATWCAYLVYLHRQFVPNAKTRFVGSYVWLIVGFALLQMCWYGVNFLPSAAASMHSYSTS